MKADYKPAVNSRTPAEHNAPQASNFGSTVLALKAPDVAGT